MKNPEIPESVMSEARRLKQYFPYRKIFIVHDPATEEFETYASVDRRAVNKRARQGATVWELKFN